MLVLASGFSFQKFVKLPFMVYNKKKEKLMKARSV